MRKIFILMTFVFSYYLSAEITEAEYNNILLNN